MRIGSFCPGSVSVNGIGEHTADSTQTSRMPPTNRTAGSGSLLPSHSIKSRKATIGLRFALGVPGD